MKENKALFVAIIFFMSLTGCVASGNAPRLSGNPNTAILVNKNSFIELNDGSFVEGEITGAKDRSGSWALFGGKYDATVQGKKYNYNSFVAIQEDGKYFRKFKNRFTQRIIHGKINIYSQLFETTGLRTSVSGNTYFTSSSHNQFYLQKGDREKIVYFDLKTLKKMISDSQPAVSLMKEYDELSNSKKRKEGDIDLDRIIAKYNDQ